MENDHFRSFPTILNRIEPYDSLKQFGVSYKEKRAQVGFTTISDPDLQIRSDAEELIALFSTSSPEIQRGAWVE